jgi:hypothetical protein
MSSLDFLVWDRILRIVGNDSLALYTETLNPQYYVVSGAEVDWRALSHADSGRCSCRDDVAGLKAHVLT